MNLIEQLGGYEHLNGFYKRAVAHGFTLTEIKEELLKYRRQHNIFEVGDKVVHDAHIGDEIYEFVSLLEDIGMATVKSKHMTGGCSLRGLRHATDAEIAAGKRL